jgi:hypothetical protein
MRMQHNDQKVTKQLQHNLHFFLENIFFPDKYTNLLTRTPRGKKNHSFIERTKFNDSTAHENTKIMWLIKFKNPLH